MNKISPYFLFAQSKYSLLILLILLAVGCSYRPGELNGEVFIVTKAGENVKLGLVTINAIPEDKIKEYIVKKNTEAKIEIEKLKPEFKKAKIEMENAAEESISAEKESSRRYMLLMKSMTRKDKNYWDEAVNISNVKSNIYNDKQKIYSDLQDKLNYYVSPGFYFKTLPDPITTAKTDSDGRFKISIQRNKRIALAAHASRQVFDHKEEYYWLVWVSPDGEPSKNIILSNDNMTDTGAKDSLITTN